MLKFNLERREQGKAKRETAVYECANEDFDRGFNLKFTNKKAARIERLIKRDLMRRLRGKADRKNAVYISVNEYFE